MRKIIALMLTVMMLLTSVSLTAAAGEILTPVSIYAGARTITAEYERAVTEADLGEIALTTIEGTAVPYTTKINGEFLSIIADEEFVRDTQEYVLKVGNTSKVFKIKTLHTPNFVADTTNKTVSDLFISQGSGTVVDVVDKDTVILSTNAGSIVLDYDEIANYDDASLVADVYFVGPTNQKASRGTFAYNVSNKAHDYAYLGGYAPKVSRAVWYLDSVSSVYYKRMVAVTDGAELKAYTGLSNTILPIGSADVTAMSCVLGEWAYGSAYTAGQLTVGTKALPEGFDRETRKYRHVIDKMGTVGTLMVGDTFVDIMDSQDYYDEYNSANGTALNAATKGYFVINPLVNNSGNYRIMLSNIALITSEMRDYATGTLTVESAVADGNKVTITLDGTEDVDLSTVEVEDYITFTDGLTYNVISKEGNTVVIEVTNPEYSKTYTLTVAAGLGYDALTVKEDKTFDIAFENPNANALEPVSIYAGARTITAEYERAVTEADLGEIVLTIIRRIKTYKPAGIRAGLMWRIRTVKHDPNGTNTDFASRLQRPYKGTIKDFLPDIPVPHFTNEEFCEYVNTLKQAAIENGNVPLHFTFDFEGDVSADYYRGGVKYFPSCMGIAQGDKALAKDVAWAVGRQLAPLGFSWIHSPVLDVNTNPKNPEIGARSYAKDPDTVAEYAAEAIKGFKEAGIIATGKHFPGRGESAADAHHGLPVIDISKEEMYEKHIKPYKKLIEAGLPAVMTAHTAYPALDDSGLPATLSKKIITGILKEELGFKGVVTTDEITMGGIISKFEVKDACLEAINAGCDLVLLRDEGGLIDEVIPALVDAVKDGRLSEERLNDAVSRTLGVKYDYGFFENEQIKEVSKASEGINDEKVKEIALRAAKQAMTVVRDENNILPLKQGTKVLFVYQVNPVHERTNTQSCNPATPWLEMLKYSDDVYCVESKMKYPEEDRKRVYERIDEADVIVVTNYFDRRNPESGNSFVKELHEKTNKPIIVVSNSPYEFTILDEYKTAICTYSSSVESFKELANVIFKGDGNVR